MFVLLYAVRCCNHHSRAAALLSVAFSFFFCSLLLIVCAQWLIVVALCIGQIMYNLLCSHLLVQSHVNELEQYTLSCVLLQFNWTAKDSVLSVFLKVEINYVASLNMIVGCNPSGVHLCFCTCSKCFRFYDVIKSRVFKATHYLNFVVMRCFPLAGESAFPS